MTSIFKILQILALITLSTSILFSCFDAKLRTNAKSKEKSAEIVEVEAVTINPPVNDGEVTINLNEFEHPVIFDSSTGLGGIRVENNSREKVETFQFVIKKASIDSITINVNSSQSSSILVLAIPPSLLANSTFGTLCKDSSCEDINASPNFVLTLQGPGSWILKSKIGSNQLVNCQGTYTTKFPNDENLAKGIIQVKLEADYDYNLCGSNFYAINKDANGKSTRQKIIPVKKQQKKLQFSFEVETHSDTTELSIVTDEVITKSLAANSNFPSIKLTDRYPKLELVDSIYFDSSKLSQYGLSPGSIFRFVANIEHLGTNKWASSVHRGNSGLSSIVTIDVGVKGNLTLKVDPQIVCCWGTRLEKSGNYLHTHGWTNLWSSVAINNDFSLTRTSYITLNETMKNQAGVLTYPSGISSAQDLRSVSPGILLMGWGVNYLGNYMNSSGFSVVEVSDPTIVPLVRSVFNTPTSRGAMITSSSRFAHISSLTNPEIYTYDLVNPDLPQLIETKTFLDENTTRNATYIIHPSTSFGHHRAMIVDKDRLFLSSTLQQGPVATSKGSLLKVESNGRLSVTKTFDLFSAPTPPTRVSYQLIDNFLIGLSGYLEANDSVRVQVRDLNGANQQVISELTVPGDVSDISCDLSTRFCVTSGPSEISDGAQSASIHSFKLIDFPQ